MTAAGACGCRFCGASLRHRFVDLGSSPPAQRFLRPDQMAGMEPFYPLDVWVCAECLLVQLREYVRAEEIFDDYAYFSSYSDTWLDHARRYTETAIPRFGLGPESQVVEVASNDGYLLQYFVRAGIPVLGIEPSANVAQAAVAKGIPTQVRFFDRDLALELVAEGRRADLLIANNVLAHVPELNRFVEGICILLAPGGVATLEFPHLPKLIEHVEFDTIYHEHYSYFSFTAVETIFAAHGLRIFDVEELPTHGGSLRIYAGRSDDRGIETSRVALLREYEDRIGVRRLEYYADFGQRVRDLKASLLEFLIEARRRGRSMAGYGAPAKGNTLLNYCGVRTDFISFTVDRNPYKHGLFCPGTRIPVLPPAAIREQRPDDVLILPWNLKDEIMAEHSYIREWGGRFVTPIPDVRTYP